MEKGLGEEKCLRIYKAMINDLFFSLGVNWGKRKILFYGLPGDRETEKYFIKKSIQFGLEDFHFFPQPEGKFFLKFESIFNQINQNYGEVFIHLTGTDIPDFPFDIIKKNRPKKNAAFIGPDFDGGFYYFGSSSKNGSIFGETKLMEGNEGIFRILKNTCIERGLFCSTLIQWGDIDNVSDLYSCLERSPRSKIPYLYAEIFS